MNDIEGERGYKYCTGESGIRVYKSSRGHVSSIGGVVGGARGSGCTSVRTPRYMLFHQRLVESE